MSRTLVVIMAHKESQETFDRHLPLWSRHGHEMIVYCPCDSVIDPRGNPMLSFGRKSHHDAMANARFRELIRMLTWTQFGRFVVHEYDSLCVGDSIPHFVLDGTEGPLLAGNVFRDVRPDRGFAGTTFIHPPFVFDYGTAKMILNALDRVSMDLEFGFYDRLLGLVAERADIPLYNFMENGSGFARNTIEEHDLNDAEAAASGGTVFYHGVKSQAALDAILRGRDRLKAVQAL